MTYKEVITEYGISHEDILAVLKYAATTLADEEIKAVSLHQYVKKALKCAEYRQGKDFIKVIAIAPVLPGCMTQGDNFEEARNNLIDAIELWITVSLRDGEEIPKVNGCRLASDHEIIEED